MALNRDKFRKIVGGITTAEPDQAHAPVATTPESVIAKPEKPAGEGREPARAGGGAAEDTATGEARRFALRGRPRGRKDDQAAGKARKVKVSLYLSESLVNDLYDWAYADRCHPGEMFERALQFFHDRETKRRNVGKE